MRFFLMLAISFLMLAISLPMVSGNLEINKEKTHLNRIDVPIVASDRIKEDVTLFSSIQSRFTGYTGSFEAAQIIADRFRKLGLNISFFNYTLLVPYDAGSFIRVGKRLIRAYGLYPNLIATGLKKTSGKLVYAGYGTLRELNGLDVNGSIVLLEFNSDSAWLNVMKLGASGIVFLEGGDTNYFEALSKISSIPLTIPRIYVRSREAIELREIAKSNPEAELFNGMEWREVEAMNVVGEMRGTEDPSKVIIITASYDSASVIPAISPGADEAVGISVMLDFIRALKQQGFLPKYTILFIAMSGHWQALAGARSFVEQFYFNNPKIGKEVFPYMVVDLKISSGSPHLNLVFSGMMYSVYTDYLGVKFRSLRNLLSESLTSFEYSFSDYWEKVNTRNLMSLSGVEWSYTAKDIGFRSGLAFNHILDMEPFEIAGSIGLGIITYDDIRYRFFTPSDRLEFVDFQNMVPQAQLTFQILFDLLKAPIERLYAGSWDELKPSRVPEAFSGLGFVTLRIEVVEYDPTSPGLYSRVPNTLITIRDPSNPFNVMISKSNSSGFTEFRGLVPTTEGRLAKDVISVRSYKIDEEGRIIYAPDVGQYGSQTYSSTLRIPLAEQFSARNVIFKCGSAVLFDITNPDTLQAATSSNTLFEHINTYSNTLCSNGIYETPLSLRISAIRIPEYTALESFGYEFDPRLSVAQVYIPPRTKCGFLVRSTTLNKMVAVYVNATLKDQEIWINGYYLGWEGDRLLINGAMLGMSTELLTLAYGRYLTQANIQVLDPKTIENLEYAIMFNKTSFSKMWSRDYGGFLANALMSWGFSNAAYQSSLNVIRDAVTSVIIIFALAIPFIILLTSLIYSLSKGFKSIIVTLTVALTVALVLMISYPGFLLTMNVPAIFMGTLIVTLIIPVLFFLYINFCSGLSQLRKQVFGLHFLERSSFDISFSAITIGVGSLKKRKFRTVLTLMCIVIVSFSLALLVSVTEMRIVRATPRPTEAKYNGILLRESNFAPLNRELVSLISTYVTNKTYIPRYWVYLPSVPCEEVAPVIVISSEKSKTQVNVVVGISPLELNASLIEFDKILLEGSMFNSEEVFSTLLPNNIAESLKVKVGNFVWINGLRLRVAGILNTTAFIKYVKDSDGFIDLLPMDTFYLSFTHMPPIREAMLSPSSLIFVPADLVKLIPEACLTSIIIPMKEMEFEEFYQKSKEIFSAFEGLNVYLTYNGTVYQFSKESVTSLFGFQYFLIPMTIAGLVVMSTILGGVMERIREGKIYNCLGLAPFQAGLMFFGENLIYATVGSMTGYLSGILVSYLMKIMNLIKLPINYTSSFVMVTIGMVIILVLLASLYPFYRISVVLTPSLERKWRLTTKPKGDAWGILLPFRIKDEEKAAGLAVFLREYLWNKRIERVGTFTVESIETNKIESGFSTRLRVWLAPFEQNIKQDMDIAILESKTEQKFFILLNIRRISGPYDLWIKYNYEFIDEIRKQILIWNTFNPKEQEKYIVIAKEMLDGQR